MDSDSDDDPLVVGCGVRGRGRALTVEKYLDLLLSSST